MCFVLFLCTSSVSLEYIELDLPHLVLFPKANSEPNGLLLRVRTARLKQTLRTYGSLIVKTLSPEPASADR